MHVGVFLIQSASLIHLVCRCTSLAITSAPVDDMVLFHSMASDGGLVNYTTLPRSGGSGFGYSRRRMTERRKKNTLQRRSISVATLPGPLTRSNGILWRNHGRAKQRKDRIKEANTKVWLLCHGLSEAYTRILKSPDIATANRPHRTLRKIFGSSNEQGQR